MKFSTSASSDDTIDARHPAVGASAAYYVHRPNCTNARRSGRLEFGARYTEAVYVNKRGDEQQATSLLELFHVTRKKNRDFMIYQELSLPWSYSTHGQGNTGQEPRRHEVGPRQMLQDR